MFIEIYLVKNKYIIYKYMNTNMTACHMNNKNTAATTTTSPNSNATTSKITKINKSNLDPASVANTAIINKSSLNNCKVNPTRFYLNIANN